MLIGAFASGGAAFAAATPVPAHLTTIGHGVFGLGVVALVPWKTVVIRRAGFLRVASVALLVVLAICVLAGFVEVLVGYRIVAGVSPIQVHVGAAVVAIPLLGWHLLRRPRQRVGRADLSRRNLLRTSVFLVGIGAGYAALEGAGHLLRLPSARRVATGSHRIDPAAVPATIWLFDRTPVLPADVTLDIDGRQISPPQLSAQARVVRSRLDCTNGWYAEGDWTAVSLSDLLDPDRLRTASSLLVTSFTGYRRRFRADQAADLYLATAYQDVPLSVSHGAPVRLVAPGHRGFWWVKWVASVVLSDESASRQSPFPLQ